MAARKTTHNPRRDEPKPRSGGKTSSLMTGLFIGLVIGLVVAAALAWHFNKRSESAFQTVESASEPSKTAKPPARSETMPDAPALSQDTSAANAVPSPVAEKTASAPGNPQTPTNASAADTPPNPAKPRVDYTFYGILPGDQPAKPMPPPVSKDIWWLQVAALKDAGDADKLRARLVLLGLEVHTQKVESSGIPLYRVRVGPYKREDDALGDLDTLAENNFEPRLFKEPYVPATTAKNKEKP